jgi:hypothetical protein
MKAAAAKNANHSMQDFDNVLSKMFQLKTEVRALLLYFLSYILDFTF